MSRGVDAGDRVGLTTVGLLLATAGGVGLATSFGAFGADRASAPVLANGVKDYVGRQQWFWPAVCAVAIVVGLLALRWLMVQLRTERTTRIDRSVDPRDGRTVVHAGALAGAVEDDARSIGGVSGASAHVTEDPSVLHLRVDLSDDGDVAAIRRQIERQTVARARSAVAQDDLPVHVELHPGKSGARRWLP